MKRPMKRTAATDLVIELEATKRAQKKPANERQTSKQIAHQTGLTELYVAQLIAKRRREIEKSIRVDVSVEHQV